MELRAAFPLLALLALGCGSPSQQAHEHPTSTTHHTASHGFKNAEKWAKRFDDPKRDAWQKPEHLVELLKIEPGMTVADLGAGTGYFLPHLSKAVGANGSVMALDVEPDMVRYMDERVKREGHTNVTARVVPPGDPELAPGSVDLVLVVNTWHHIADRDSYVQLLTKALKPAGRVVVVDFTAESPYGPPMAHRLKPQSVAQELGQTMAVGTMLDQLPHQYIVVGQLAQTPEEYCAKFNKEEEARRAQAAPCYCPCHCRDGMPVCAPCPACKEEQTKQQQP